MSLLKESIQTISNDENIGNHGYIGTSILQKKISIGLKLLKTHGNVRKTS